MTFVTLAGLAVRGLNGGDRARLVSAEGGVSVEVPHKWALDVRHPTDPRHAEYLRGHERGVVGFVERRGFWVSRWSVAAGTTVDVLKTAMAKTAGPRRHDVRVSDGVLAGQPAAVLTYRRAPHGLGRLRLSDTEFTVRQIVIGDFTYQVGTWQSQRFGDRNGDLAHLVATFAVSDPAPWTTKVDHASLRLPGGWTQRPSNLSSAQFYAVAPGDPSHTWAYLFHDRTRSQAAMADLARTTIVKNNGAVYSERDDRGATRIDFVQPDKQHQPTYDVSWIRSDGHGGSYVLSVARREGDASVAESLFAGLQVASQ